MKEREHKSSSKRRRTADLSTEPARARGNKRREVSSVLLMQFPMLKETYLVI